MVANAPAMSGVMAPALILFDPDTSFVIIVVIGVRVSIVVMTYYKMSAMPMKPAKIEVWADVKTWTPIKAGMPVIMYRAVPI